MNRAANDILQQAWERGRKYGNEEKKDIERPIKGIAKTDENGKIKIELLIPQEAEWIIFPTNRLIMQCPECTAFLSRTRSDIFKDRIGKMNFCPNCGVRMITASEVIT